MSRLQDAHIANNYFAVFEDTATHLLRRSETYTHRNLKSKTLIPLLNLHALLTKRKIYSLVTVYNSKITHVQGHGGI